MPQSHTADQPMATRGRDTERLQPKYIRKTIEVMQATSSLTLLQRDNCNYHMMSRLVVKSIMH